MGVATIPTKTDTSLGRVKADRAPVPNRDEYVNAAELEAIKSAIIANATAIGLSDGTTAGSLEALLAYANLPEIRPTRWAYRDDFFKFDTSDDHTVQTVSGGTVAAIAGVDADADTGVGHVKLSVSTTSDVARFFSTQRFVRGDHGATARFRLKLVGTVTNYTFNIGLYDNNTANSYALFTKTGAGSVWAVSSGSDDLASTDSATSAVTITTGWHDCRLEIDDGNEAVSFYVDEVLVGSLGVSPVANDAMSLWVELSWFASTGGSIIVDWEAVEGVR